MKKWLLAAPLASLLASCGSGGNVYPMTVQQAYDKLVAAEIEPSGTGPFYRRSVSVSGDGTSTVTWQASGDHSSVECEANLAPEGADKTRISAFCGGASAAEGAAAGMVLGSTRNRLIEHIDATLRGRAFDIKLAMGSTASGWPTDPRQPDSSIAAAAGQALAMERDTHRMLEDMEKTTAEAEAQLAEKREARRANAGVTFKPGEPMIDVTK